jgi:hypothetical protein
VRLGAVAGERDDDHIVRRRGRERPVQVRPDRVERGIRVGQEARVDIGEGVLEERVECLGIPNCARKLRHARVLVLVNADEECLERHMRPQHVPNRLSRLYVGSGSADASVNLCLTLRSYRL